MMPAELVSDDEQRGTKMDRERIEPENRLDGNCLFRASHSRSELIYNGGLAVGGR